MPTIVGILIVISREYYMPSWPFSTKVNIFMTFGLLPALRPKSLLKGVYFERKYFTFTSFGSSQKDWICSLIPSLYRVDPFLERNIFGKVITKTCLYNFDPRKPHFYIIKLGFTGVYIIFLVSAQKHRLWVLVRTASARRFKQVPTIYVLSRNMKNI